MPRLAKTLPVDCKKYAKKHPGASVNDKKAFLDDLIQKRVNSWSHRRRWDISTVVSATAASTAVPYSGVLVAVPYVVVRCVACAFDLGLMSTNTEWSDAQELKETRRLANDLNAAVQQGGNAGKEGVKAAAEAVVFEFLKSLAAPWLWEEILKNVVTAVIEDLAVDYWILTPLFVPLKYGLHRHLVKSMYEKLGERASAHHMTAFEGLSCLTSSSSSTLPTSD